jgi:hypothetical protein
MALAILAVVTLASLYSSYFRNGVWLIRLGCLAGVNTARSQKQQFLHPIAKGGLSHIGLQHQVAINEVNWAGVVDMDTTDPAAAK